MAESAHILNGCMRVPAASADWDSWTDWATGEIVASFSMLSINADGHPVMDRFHRPGDERRSLVVVPLHAWHKWLNATTGTASDLLTDMPTAEFGAGPASGEAAPASISRTSVLCGHELAF